MLNLRRGSLLSDFWGGGGAIPTYDTLAAVIAAGLPDGSLWHLAWTGDAYEADGQVIGTIVAGDPSWRGIIPWPKIGTTPTVVTSALSGALGADAQGRPRLTTIASNGSLVEVNLGLRLRTPTLYQLNVLHTQPAQADSVDSVLVAQLAREDNTGLRLWNYLAFVGGSWVSGHFQTGAPSGGAAPVGAATTAGQFAGGRKIELLLTLPSERKIAQPSLYTTGRTPAGGVTSEAVTAVIGTNGDFTGAQKFLAFARLRSTSVAQAAIITGVALAAA